MGNFVSFRDANKTNEEGAGVVLAKLVGQSVVVGAETSLRVEEKGGGADDSVDVQIGQTIILDADGYGLRGWIDAIVNKTVTANVSGNDRIDIVVAYVDKAVEDAVNNNSPGGLVIDIIEGTPAGAPVPPSDATIQAAVGADNPFIKLAEVEADDAFVSIVNADITDIREQCSFQSGGKKLQYQVATDTWELEDKLGVDTINEKTAAAGVTVEGVLIKDSLVDGRDVSEMFWENIGEVTLGVAGDVLSVASLPPRRFLKIIGFMISSGVTNDLLTFNNDTGNNYARRSSTNGGADASAGSQPNLAIGSNNADTDKFDIIDVTNVATKEKLVISENNDANIEGAANVPLRRSVVGKWANTAVAINRVDIINTQAGSYAAGSKMVVLGHD